MNMIPTLKGSHPRLMFDLSGSKLIGGVIRGCCSQRLALTLSVLSGDRVPFLTADYQVEQNMIDDTSSAQRRVSHEN
jgi:hypothetical protein